MSDADIKLKALLAVEEPPARDPAFALAVMERIDQPVIEIVREGIGGGPGRGLYRRYRIVRMEKGWPKTRYAGVRTNWLTDDNVVIYDDAGGWRSPLF